MINDYCCFFCFSYHNQAAKEADIVYRRVQQLLRELNQPPETISEADTRLFCKHASNLQLVRGTCIADEYQGKNPNLQNIGTNTKVKFL